MTLTREPSSRRASQIGEDFVDPTSDLADDALADVHQLRIVSEADAGELDLAVHLDEAARRAVDHDVGDVVAGEQRLERAEAEHVVADVVEQILLLGDRQDRFLIVTISCTMSRISSRASSGSSLDSAARSIASISAPKISALV